MDFSDCRPRPGLGDLLTCGRKSGHMDLLAGRARRRFQSVGHVICARSPDRSRLAHGACRPEEQGHLPHRQRVRRVVLILLAGIGHLCLQPGLSARLGEIYHGIRCCGDSSGAVAHLYKGRADAGVMGNLIIAAGVLCAGAFFGRHPFPAGSRGTAGISDGLQF